MSRNKAPQTIAASNGIGEDTAHGAVTPPLVLSSSFTFEGFNRPRRYDYTRSGNPTRDLLADTVAQLEGGAGAVVVTTGMAAVDLSLASLEPGDLIVAPHDCYAGTWRLLNARQAKRQFDVMLVDQNDPEALAGALARSPKLVLIETPSNPLMRVVDIRKIAAATRRRARKPLSTTRFCRRRCSGHLRSARTWSCIRRPSSSMGIRMWSAVWSSRRPNRMLTLCGTGPIARA